MKSKIIEQINNLKHNDDHFDDRKYYLEKALRKLEQVNDLIEKAEQLPEDLYEVIKVKFVYFNHTYNATARLRQRNQEIYNIKVVRQGHRWMDTMKYSTKLRNHLEDYALNEFNKLFTWKD